MIRIIVVLALTFSFVPSTFATDKPNIILIMADDVGIEGLGCYGGTSYKTPNLDRMAREGVRFTRAYSQPLCTPTRVQLMTGKYNHRNWRAFGILDPNENTFGHAMSAAGYKTGIFGKWQLQSYDPPELPGSQKRRGTGMHPKDAGFDEYALYHALHTEDKGSRYANPTMLEGAAGSDGDLNTHEGRYGEDVWVEKILDFFDRHSVAKNADKDAPKFVYYPMALPHWPFQPTPGSDGWDPSKPQETHLRFAGDMIEYMDTAVGKLLDGLSKRNLQDNTIVIFYSDNGTHLEVTSKMKDGRSIKGGKATPQQTGIHVPLIVHWPGRFEASVCDEIVDASDFFPTLLELAGAKPIDDSIRDGISFAPLLQRRDEPIGDKRDETPRNETHRHEKHPHETHRHETHRHETHRHEKHPHEKHPHEKPRREAAFFWYDPRPGWDKERFHRSVFAVNKTHKYFRDGRLLRLTDRPLGEILIDPKNRNEKDLAAVKQLRDLIASKMRDVVEPPLVDAYGKPAENVLEAVKSAN